jgi:FkbM family methyltransferase
MLGRIRRIAHRHWSERRNYLRTSDWLLAIYNRVMLHAPKLHLPGKGRVRSVHPRGLAAPLAIRLGTSDWYVLEEIFFNGEYSSLIAARPAGIRTILDLGANVGMTIRLWMDVFPEARIAAVEPDAANVQMIRRNLAGLDRGDGIYIARACAAGRPRPVTLKRDVADWAFSMAEPAPGAPGELPALTVPQILTDAHFEGPVDLLKCDIEGAEAEVFAECAPWIGRVRFIAIELHAPYTTDRFLDDLRRNGGRFTLLARQDKGDLAILLLSQDGPQSQSPAATPVASTLDPLR